MADDTTTVDPATDATETPADVPAIADAPDTGATVDMNPVAPVSVVVGAQKRPGYNQATGEFVSL